LHRSAAGGAAGADRDPFSEGGSAPPAIARGGRPCVRVRAGGSSFAAAEALFDQIGARIEARQIRDHSGRPTLPAGLTDRDAEVLRLVAEGRTKKETAAQLYRSTKTVSRHLSNIFTKIGRGDRIRIPALERTGPRRCARTVVDVTLRVLSG
jgi:DNA-binding CsgD family transcriptional regulator